nr:YegP family protein [Robiginitalea marina]
MEVQENGNNGYRFLVKSREGHLLLESVGFSTLSEVRACLSEVRGHLGSPACFERRTNHRGQFQFALKSLNGRVLGFSGPYRSEAGMENGIKNTLARLRESGPSEGKPIQG